MSVSTTNTRSSFSWNDEEERSVSVSSSQEEVVFAPSSSFSSAQDHHATSMEAEEGGSKGPRHCKSKGKHDDKKRTGSTSAPSEFHSAWEDQQSDEGHDTCDTSSGQAERVENELGISHVKAEFISPELQVETKTAISFEKINFSVRHIHGLSPPALIKRLILWLKNGTFKEKGLIPFFVERKHILRGVSGTFFPGRLTAVMGPSGSGKTSLLNVLARRQKSGKISGKVTVNGQKVDDETMNHVAGYVVQEDILYPQLSPKEHLFFYSRIRLPRTLSRKKKKRRIKQTLSVLGLEDCATTRVGDPGQSTGISGGERRRTMIATELLQNPRALFLDEPTSGLDSTTAEQVVSMLRSVAKQGRAVICTIHQPSSEVFHLFDDVYWIAKGRLIYSGPVDQLQQWFTALGYPCPKYTNPADYYMRLLNHTPDITEKEYFDRLDFFHEKHEEQRILHEPDRPYTERVKRDYKRPWFFWQFFYLLLRSLITYGRNKFATIGRFFQVLVMVFFSAVIFWQLDDDQKGIRDTLGAILNIVLFQMFPAGVAAIIVFDTDKRIFYHEYGKGMYKVILYYTSRTLAQVPFTVLIPAVFGCLVYWPIGLRYEPGPFFIFVIILVLLYSVCTGLATVMSIILPFEVAMGLFPVVIIPHLIMAGLFINIDSLPYYLIWFPYTSFSFYSFMALTINEFEGQDYTCASDEFINGVCPLTTGEAVIERYSFDGWEIWTAVVALFTMVIWLHVFSYCALLCTGKRKSKL